MNTLTTEYVASLATQISSGIDNSKDLVARLNLYLRTNFYKTSFLVNNLGQLHEVTGESSKIISNFLVVPTGNKVIHYLEYEERVLEVYCLVNKKWFGPFSLTAKQLRNDKDWIRNSVGFEAVTYHSYKFIEEFINLLIPLAPTIHEYSYIGWAKKHPGIYITGSSIIGQENETVFPHPNLIKYQLKRPQVAEELAVSKMFGLFFKLGPANWILPAIAYSLLSLYKSLLEDLPQVPDFVMYVYGKSGSRKTSVSKLLFNPFDDWDFVPLNFTATTPAMENARMERRDCVTLIDDIPPSLNPQEHKVMMSKLEAIFRSTGDSVGRKKMIGARTSVEMKAQGMAAITAEDLYVKSASSVARGYFIKVYPNTVNLPLLTEAQKTHHIYSAAFHYFIRHISNDVESFVSHASELYKEYELQYSKSHIAHGRQIASSAWLHTSMQLYLDYAMKINAITEDIYIQTLKEFEAIMSLTLSDMVRLNEINDEVELFVRAMKELITTRTVVLADITLTGLRKNVSLGSDHLKVLGFRDARYLYLLHDSVFNQVCSHYNKQGKAFPVTQEALWNSLKHKNLLIPDRNKDGTKTVRITINGDRVSVIRIDRLAYENWGDTPFNFDTETELGSLASSFKNA